MKDATRLLKQASTVCCALRDVRLLTDNKNGRCEAKAVQPPPWWLAAVQVIKPLPSMLADRTHVKLKS